ncbi:hypothetical protein FHETE_2526 [Fusarium heterosporum]|uniref:Uncharacterized protein n=1 Tax=Fusarium heterosporum TaxID=42747 RepID=A0A8H5WZB7_FUSHE|nr:hypothetical protein FHETE_2526 [Fusarium heterosporum]
MPTATGYFGYSVHNLGPLTTTFTAPSSCATGTDHVIYANVSSNAVFYGAPTCDFASFADCIPSGKSWDSVYRQTTTFVQGQFLYYSPGIACPSGWKTAGALARGESGSVSASGVLSYSASNAGGNTYARALHPSEVWLEVLEPSETLVYCCPSNYTADAYANCVSTLGPRSSFTYSEMCLTYAPIEITQIATLDGTTLTQDLISIVSGSGTAETFLTDAYLTGSAMSDIVVATYMPAVPLVYKQSDLEGDEKNETTGRKDDGSGESEKDDENAASTTTKNGGLSVLGLSLSMLVGAGMLMLW